MNYESLTIQEIYNEIKKGNIKICSEESEAILIDGEIRVRAKSTDYEIIQSE